MLHSNLLLFLLILWFAGVTFWYSNLTLLLFQTTNLLTELILFGLVIYVWQKFYLVPQVHITSSSWSMPRLLWHNMPCNAPTDIGASGSSLTSMPFWCRSNIKRCLHQYKFIALIIPSLHSYIVPSCLVLFVKGCVVNMPIFTPGQHIWLPASLTWSIGP